MSPAVPILADHNSSFLKIQIGCLFAQKKKKKKCGTGDSQMWSSEQELKLCNIQNEPAK